MKKLFWGIGVLFAVFSIYFFLLVVDKDVYVNDEYIYDYYLNDQYISMEELDSLARNCDLMIQLRTYEGYSFGQNRINILLLNPEDDISAGLQNSVFPGSRIYYQLTPDNRDSSVKAFTIQENDQQKLQKFDNQLKTADYGFDIIESAPIKFSAEMIFSTPNARFFSSFLILTFLCMITYYIHRLKEIGILKLNGWNNWKISKKIIRTIYSNTVISSLVPMGIMSVYIIISDHKRLVLYWQICLCLHLFVILTYAISAAVASLFIDNVNQVNAIKNGKNNRKILSILIIAKCVTTCLLFLSIKQVNENVQLLSDGMDSANKIKKYDFYSLDTTTIPSTEMQTELDAYLNTLPDKDVYNYASPDISYSYHELTHNTSEKLSMEDMDCNLMEISDNLLDKMHIKDADGKILTSTTLNAGEEVLLVPVSYKENIQSLIKSLCFSTDTNICYIENNQIHQDLLMPGWYAYNCVIVVHPVKKQMYLNVEEVLYNKSSAAKINSRLEELHLDSGSISIQKKNNEIEVFIANYMLEVWESGFFMAINLLSYGLSMIATAVIYLEFRKKEITVYAVMGKLPWKVIRILLLFNLIITFGFAMLVKINGAVFILLELICDLAYLRTYLNKKIILALKGE